MAACPGTAGPAYLAESLGSPGLTMLVITPPGRDLCCARPMAGSDLPPCCCSDGIAGLARDPAGRLAGIARREGVTAADALDLVQDAFHTLLGRPDIAALRTRPPDDAARLLGAIVRN